MPEVSKKIVYYDAKLRAIDDCLNVLKTNEDMGLSASLKIIRKLSSKQFNAIVKRGKLMLHIQNRNQQ